MRLVAASFRSTLLAAAAFAAAGCSREPGHAASPQAPGGSLGPAPAAEQEQALVRVVNAIPGGGAADLFAHGVVVFPSVDYMAVTTYREIPDDRTTFRLRPAGHDTAEPLAEKDDGLVGGQHYTVVALPGGANEPPTLEVVRDDYLPPSRGKSKLRVLNASPDAGNVQVVMDGRLDPLVTGTQALSESEYREVDPVAGPLEVRQQDGTRVLARMPEAQLAAGKLYTLILFGRSAGSPGVAAVMLEDEPAPDRATS